MNKNKGGLDSGDRIRRGKACGLAVPSEGIFSMSTDKGGGFGMELVHEEEIGQEHLRALERIMEQVECQKDFACYRSGLESLCAAKDIGTDICLECLEAHPENCKFALATGESYLFGDTFLCACPIRVYICKKLKR